MSFSISHVLFVLDSSLHPWNQYPEQHSAAPKTSGLTASPLPSLCLPLPPQSQECMHGTCEAGLSNFNILSVTLSIGAWHQNGSGWMLVLALPQGDGIGQLYFFGWRGPREDASMAGVRGRGWLSRDLGNWLFAHGHGSLFIFFQLVRLYRQIWAQAG